VAERYLKPAEVSEITRLAPNTLKWLRHVGRGPAYVKAGRTVLYPESAVLSWLESNRHEPLPAA
jgi:Helix-turn-helix domain